MLRGSTAGRIGIKSQGNLPGELLQLLNVLLGDGTADTRYCLFCPILVRDYCVYISLYYNDLMSMFYCILSHIYGIEHAIFLKQDRLWRVQVLWFTITQRSPTKSYDPTTYVTYWKDETISKIIIH